MESSVYAVLAIAIAIGVALALGGGNLQFSFYLVALCGMGMLATTGVIVSEDTFGPVSDNAAGIAEMSGEFHGEPERIMVSLDAVGNTTKAVTKGFAIGSAVIAAVALFASFIETAVNETLPQDVIDAALKTSRGVFDLLPINVADPKVFIGLLIGGAVPFLFSALAIRAVGRTAGVVVQEVRKQFADGKIMKGEKQPEYGPVIDICTEASLRELATPALLAVLTPVIVGFGINFFALGAFLAAVILVGQLMANYLSNSGGAWDNAKKYIEDGHHGGKGSDPYRAAVIADTVGDPFKDTAGPALNPLIKVMNLVSLLILPAIISLAGQRRCSLLDRRGGAGRADRRDHLLQPQGWVDRRTHDRRPDRRHSYVLALFDIENWLDKGGLALAALIIFAETGLLIGFFLPGDSLLFIAGFLSSKPEGLPHLPSIGLVVPVLIVAAFVGDQVGYLIGRKVRPVGVRPPGARGSSTSATSPRTQVFFERHGTKAIVLARFVPIVRTFVPVLAGVGKMKHRTFVIVNVIGAVPVGRRRHHARLLPRPGRRRSRTTSRSPAVVIVAISLLPVGIEFMRHRREARSAPPSE